MPSDKPCRGGEMVPIEGQVWCHEHGVVHDDTRDPYDYGHPDCKKENHRKIRYRARKGDWR